MSSRTDRRAGSVGRLVLAVVIAAAALVVAPAPAASAATSISTTGHGWGHGRGMGQWGAYGYATQFGWSSAQILDHFYGGTTAGVIDGTAPISVRLLGRDDLALRVTSGQSFWAGGTLFPAGRAVEIAFTGGQWVAQVFDGCFGAEVVGESPRVVIDGGFQAATDPGDDLSKMLTICAGNTYRGILRLLYPDGLARTINVLPLDQYIRGVVPRESPSSWPAAALQAQAVAARSYAWAENRYPYARTCDTTSCQVYLGAGANGTRLEATSTDNAIAATAGVVRMTSGGAVARTEFSSSTGGYTAGGTFPAVPDLGDAVPANPNHTWKTDIAVSSLESRYGIGTFTGIAVTARNGLGDWGGRVTQLRVTGTTRSVTLTGEQFRVDFALKSNWFTFGVPDQTWHLRNTNSAGAPDITFLYGGPHDVALMCDWDGDGRDSPGVFADGTWYLRNSNAGGPPDIVVSYGVAGYVPVCGDWDADGDETIGVYVNGTWYLRNSNTPGSPDITVSYGTSAYTPVVGNWDGVGGDSIGVYVNGTWYLRNDNMPGAPHVTVSYGTGGYTPVVGNWDGAGGDSIGVYVGGNWYLRNSVTPGAPDLSIAYGAPGYRPVVGDYDQAGQGGTDTIGVVVPPSA
jgi:SpoIID/LytB domain protein